MRQAIKQCFLIVLVTTLFGCAGAGGGRKNWSPIDKVGAAIIPHYKEIRGLEYDFSRPENAGDRYLRGQREKAKSNKQAGDETGGDEPATGALPPFIKQQ